jgi:serine O-acetyltransferase
MTPNRTSHLSDIAEKLSLKNREYSYPNISKIREFAATTLGCLFSHFRSDNDEPLQSDLEKLSSIFIGINKHPLTKNIDTPPSEVLVEKILSHLLFLQEQLFLDANAIYKGDPAAQTLEEVIATYPGFLAIAYYRIAHILHQLSVPFIPRVITEYAHFLTGIDIHPGAVIGGSFFIDHGTGVVIGGTAIIGNNVKIYQGVTLGALSVKKELHAAKRHPTIGDNTIIYANATILGGETVIGHDTIIGGGAWVIESVPPYSKIYNKCKIKSHEI